MIYEATYKGLAAGALTDASGNAVTSQTTYTPESPDGKTTLEFPIDPAAAPGKVVVFEEMTVKSGDKDVTVAEHADIHDESQTVHIPQITTQASDSKTGDHNGKAETTAIVIDEATYKGLAAGAAYKIEGTLMDKSTGQEFLDDGQKVTATAAFEPKKPDGTVSLQFDIEHTVMDGRSVVVFERLYDASGNVVAVHEDINSAEQAVSYRSSSLDKLGSPFDKTGYWFAQYWWVILALAGACLLIGVFRYMTNGDESVFSQDTGE